MSLETPLYLFFLAVVFLLYYALEPGAPRRALLLGASYYFYYELSGLYIVVLGLVTVLTYWGARAIRSSETRRPGLFFAVVIALVLTPLLALKYLGPLLQVLGAATGQPHFLPTALSELALPVGISFFTFAALGYLIDVYLEVMEPEPSLAKVALFLAFFPLVSAGPIERGERFIAQFDLDQKFSADRAFSALRLIFIGLVLKVLLAEGVQKQADQIMDSPQSWHPIELLSGLFHYTFFIYADFAGYSLIAIGSAKLLGLEVQPNFRQPFLSSTVPEFWRNWHISLSSWVRDYIFVPLRTQWRHHPRVGLPAALMISIVTIGVWHGAKWGYLAFGLMHGTLVTTSTLTLQRRNVFWKSIGVKPEALYLPRMAVTFTLIMLVFVVFRANTMTDAFYIYRHLFSVELLQNFRQLVGAAIGHHSVSNIFVLSEDKSWIFILAIIVGDVMASKKLTLEKFPLILQFAVYTIGVFMLFSVWINAYVPHPFVYNKF